MRMVFLTALASGCAAESMPLYPSAVETDNGMYELTFVPGAVPYISSEEVTLEISIQEADQPADSTLAITPWMPDHGHGISDAPQVQLLSPGVFDASWIFSMPGFWELTFEVDGPAGADSVVTAWEVR